MKKFKVCIPATIIVEVDATNAQAAKKVGRQYEGVEFYLHLASPGRLSGAAVHCGKVDVTDVSEIVE